jgi:hypothetical protein
VEIECRNCNESGETFDGGMEEMRKHDNDWEIGEKIAEYSKDQDSIHGCFVTINTKVYYMPEHLAGLTHAILLLVDAINDKQGSI